MNKYSIPKDIWEVREEKKKVVNSAMYEFLPRVLLQVIHEDIFIQSAKVLV
jgi:hypothetical protein